MTKKTSKGKQTAQKGRNSNGASSSYTVQSSGMAATAGNTRVMSSFRRSPRMVQNGSSLRVCNTERVNSAVSFTDGAVNAARLAFNPCNTNILTWLPQVARNYSQYVVHGLKYSWVPRAATTVTAELQLGLFYDYADAEYYISTLAGATQLDNLGEFACGTAWQGGTIAAHDSKMLNIPQGWFGIIADTAKLHARVQRFTCNSTGGGGTAGENQVCPCHLITRTYTPTGSTVPGGQIYVSYDIEFFHPTIAAANANPYSFTLADDPSVGKACWKESPDGTWAKVPCGGAPPPQEPLPAPKPDETEVVSGE